MWILPLPLLTLPHRTSRWPFSPHLLGDSHLVAHLVGITGNLLSTFKAHPSTFMERNGGNHYVAWSPDGTCLISANWYDMSIKTRDATTGDLLSTRTCGTKSVSSASWSPDSTRFASSDKKGVIKVWNTTIGNLLHTFTGHTKRVRVFAWSPDNTRLVSASDEDTILKIWNITTGDSQTLSSYVDDIRCAAWSPDSKTLALGHEDRTAVSDGGDGGGIIYTGSDKPTIRIWDITKCHLLQTLSGHSGSVEDIAWSPDGTHFACGNLLGTVQVWIKTIE